MDDPLFMEFLETHTGDNMKGVWSNDSNTIEKLGDKYNEDDETTDDEDDKKEENIEEKKIANKVISDLEVRCNYHWKLVIYRSLGIHLTLQTLLAFQLHPRLKSSIYQL